MFEAVGVLAIFFILLGIGATVYFKIQESAARKELARQQELAALQQAIRVTWLPELDCSFLGVKKERCFDLAKIKVFSELRKNKTFEEAYFPIFGFSTVLIKEIWPEKETYVIYNRTKEGRVFPVRVPVALQRDALNGIYSFAILEILNYA